MKNKNKKVTLQLYKRPSTEDELKLYSYISTQANVLADNIYKEISMMPIDKGGLILVEGPMNSGKSIVACKLLLMFKSDKKHKNLVTCAQPEVDRPDVINGEIYSRSGVSCKAIAFKTKQDIEDMFHHHNIVILDEIQFMPYDVQVYFLYELTRFVERGGWVVAMCLHYTSQQMEFVLPALLFERAEKTYTLKATCQMCGKVGAVGNQRLVDGKPVRVYAPDFQPPNGHVTYEPRCADCLVV